MSRGAREIYEADPDEIRRDAGRVLDVIHPDDLTSFHDSVAEAATRLMPWKWTGRIITASGRLKWIECASRPERKPDGEVMWDGLVMDISAHRQTEEALRHAQGELEERVEERTHEVVERTHQLEAANEALQSEVKERTRIEAQLRARANSFAGIKWRSALL